MHKRQTSNDDDGDGAEAPEASPPEVVTVAGVSIDHANSANMEHGSLAQGYTTLQTPGNTSQGSGENGTTNDGVNIWGNYY